MDHGSLRGHGTGVHWCALVQSPRCCSAAGVVLRPPRLQLGWFHGQESAPGFLRTSLLGKWTERRCASPSVKEGGGAGGESHPLPRAPRVPRVMCLGWAPSSQPSEVHEAAQLEGEHAEEDGAEAGARAVGTVAVLFVGLAPRLLAQDPLEAHGADAALVLVAGAAVLAEQELLVADVGYGMGGREGEGSLSMVP